MIPPPMLYMPEPPGNLTSPEPMERLQMIPWDGEDAEDKFTVYTLGQKLRASKPVNVWLKQFGIELVRLPDPHYFRLVTPEWRTASGMQTWTSEDEDPHMTEQV